MLAGSVPLLLAYGAAGLAYGHLAMPTPFGFVDMPGACAWLTATTAFALALAALAHLAGGDAPLQPPQSRVVITSHTLWAAPGRPLRQVEARTTLPPPAQGPTLARPRLLRRIGLFVAAVAGAAALAGRGLMQLGGNAFAQPAIALAPQAAWPLGPLPWTWPALLPLARDAVVIGLFAIGLLLLAFCGLLSRWKVRSAWLPAGLVVPLLVALGHFGSAAYDFAAPRGLGGLQDADALRALAADPGRHNAYTFLSLWIGVVCTSVGPLLGALVCRSETPNTHD